MTPKEVLNIMEDIEKEKPLSGQHEPDGRFVWVNRWEYLKKVIKLIDVLEEAK